MSVTRSAIESDIVRRAAARSLRLATFVELLESRAGTMSPLAWLGLAAEMEEAAALMVAIGDVDARPVEPGIVVLGLPRTGTTLAQRTFDRLHGGDRSPLGWHLSTVNLRSLASGGGPIERTASVDVGARYRAVLDLSPSLGEMHRLGPYEYEECTPLFRCDARHFPWLFMVPPDDELFEFFTGDFGAVEAHRHWAAALTLLGPGRTTVLKSPLHTAYLGSLASTCGPATKFVVVRRDAMAMLGSLAALVWALWNGLGVGGSPEALRRFVVRLVSAIGDAFSSQLQHLAPGALSVIDYDDLVRDPAATCRSVIPGLPSANGSWECPSPPPGKYWQAELFDGDDVAAIRSAAPLLVG